MINKALSSRQARAPSVIMRGILFQRQKKTRILILIGDLAIFLAGFSLVLFVRVYGTDGAPWSISKIAAVASSIITLTISVFYILDLYEGTGPQSYGSIFLSICLAFGIVMTLYSALAYFVIGLRPGRLNLVLFIFITLMLTFAWRMVCAKMIHIRPKSLLLIGNEPILEDIRRAVQSDYAPYFTIAGHWHRHDPFGSDGSPGSEKDPIDMMVYSFRSAAARHLADGLMKRQVPRPNVIDALVFYQHLTHKYPVSCLNELLLGMNAPQEIFFPDSAARMKRVFDLMIILLLLPLALPLWVLFALAIKMETSGPVLFIQERVGKDEVPFQLYKFRTMIHQAEADTGPQWSLNDDPRITKVGKVLRKLRLDELPQLVNVFKGDMSVVGPRPIRQHFADILTAENPYYRLRFLVKPGLTGWAQVNYGYGGSYAGQLEKLPYDLFYLVHQSIWLDLLILLKTIKVMVRGKGT